MRRELGIRSQRDRQHILPSGASSDHRHQGCLHSPVLPRPLPKHTLARPARILSSPGRLDLLLHRLNGLPHLPLPLRILRRFLGPFGLCCYPSPTRRIGHVGNALRLLL